MAVWQFCNTFDTLRQISEGTAVTSKVVHLTAFHKLPMVLCAVYQYDNFHSGCTCVVLLVSMPNCMHVITNSL